MFFSRCCSLLLYFSFLVALNVGATTCTNATGRVETKPFYVWAHSSDSSTVNRAIQIHAVDYCGNDSRILSCQTLAISNSWGGAGNFQGFVNFSNYNVAEFYTYYAVATTAQGAITDYGDLASGAEFLTPQPYVLLNLTIGGDKCLSWLILNRTTNTHTYIVTDVNGFLPNLTNTLSASGSWPLGFHWVNGNPFPHLQVFRVDQVRDGQVEALDEPPEYFWQSCSSSTKEDSRTYLTEDGDSPYDWGGTNNTLTHTFGPDGGLRFGTNYTSHATNGIGATEQGLEEGFTAAVGELDALRKALDYDLASINRLLGILTGLTNGFSVTNSLNITNQLNTLTNVSDDVTHQLLTAVSNRLGVLTNELNGISTNVFDARSYQGLLAISNELVGLTNSTSSTNLQGQMVSALDLMTNELAGLSTNVSDSQTHTALIGVSNLLYQVSTNRFTDEASSNLFALQTNALARGWSGYPDEWTARTSSIAGEISSQQSLGRGYSNDLAGGYSVSGLSAPTLGDGTETDYYFGTGGKRKSAGGLPFGLTIGLHLNNPVFSTFGYLRSFLRWLIILGFAAWNFQSLYKEMMFCFMVPQARTAGTEILGTSVNGASALAVGALIVATVSALPAAMTGGGPSELASAFEGASTAASSLASQVGFAWSLIDKAFPLATFIASFFSRIIFSLTLHTVAVATCGIIKVLVGV